SLPPWGRRRADVTGRHPKCYLRNAPIRLSFPDMSRDSLLTAFTEAVDDDPENVYARFNLAKLLAAEGRHQEAVAHLDRVNKLVPGYEGGAGWFNRGVSLAAMGRYAEAAASFDRVMKVPYTGRCSHATALAKKAAALDKLG